MVFQGEWTLVILEISCLSRNVSCIQKNGYNYTSSPYGDLSV